MYSLNNFQKRFPYLFLNIKRSCASLNLARDHLTGIKQPNIMSHSRQRVSPQHKVNQSTYPEMGRPKVNFVDKRAPNGLPGLLFYDELRE